MKTYLLIITVILGCSTASFGQRSATEIAVRNLFEQKENIYWFRYYKGRMDGLNDISISLAYDGRSCKGYLTYLRSRERFQLEGTIIGDNQVKIKELDKSGAVSGYFEGEIKGAYLNAEWNNYNYSIGGTVSLRQVEKEPRLPSYCGEDKWIKQYEGVLIGEAFTLLLQKTSNNLIKGVAYSKFNDFVVSGNINEHLQLDLIFRNALNIEVGTLKGNHSNAYQMGGNYIDAKGNTSSSTFQLVQQLDMGCIEYADYITSYDITYPKTKNPSFNQWMDKQAMSWVISCRDRVQKIKTSFPSKQPYLRATERAYAWTDIVYLSDELISGYVHFSTTWTEEDQTQMFNFDLKRGKPLGAEDIFKGRYKRFIRNQIKNEFKRNRFYTKSDFRKWILKTGFTLFTIREEGIYFSTKFNAIYGQQHVLIPFGKLKPYLRKNTPVARLATS